MSYCTIEDVRDLSGEGAHYEHGHALVGACDGANKTFYVTTGVYIVDSDSDEDGFDAVPDYTDDVIVYDDGVSVAITSIDTRRGVIILTAAPAAASKMTVDFAWSRVRDENIAAIITRADALIETETRTSNSATAKTQYWDGDGSVKEFFFKRFPVTSITTITVDSDTTYVLNTDYWLYPEPTLARYIRFLSAPSEDNQNVVITYSYGATSELLKKLSMYLSAREIVIELHGSGGGGKSTYTGRSLKTTAVAANKYLSLVLRLDEEIKRLWAAIGGKVQISKV